jgi:hypothetical protein
MTHTVDKIGAAVHQLDWAIRLLIDHDAPIPAITLAGAAEEILGKSLTDPLSSAHKILMRNLASAYQLKEKAVLDEHLNKARNWFKHWNAPIEPENETFDLLNEAIQIIARAISNLIEYDRSLPSEGLRFLQWVDNRNLNTSETE